MTVTHVLLVSAPHASARALAESMLGCFGVSAAVIGSATYLTAQTESAALALPLGVDYHSFPDQNLPAGVSVVGVSGSYIRRIREEFAHIQDLGKYLWGSTHLIRVTHPATDAASHAATEAIARFGRRHRISPLDDQVRPR